MRITLERIGGFTGMRMTRVINTDQLPSKEADQLHQLLTKTDFFHQPAETLESSRQPDRFQYRVCVEDGKRKHTVLVSETAMSHQFRQLIDRLNAALRKPSASREDKRA